MNHGYYQDRLSAYFDQALTGEEMQAVEEHLADCAECQSRLDDLAKLDRLIEDKAGLGESEYWEKAAQKIEQRIGSVDDEKTTDVRSGWFGLGWKLVAAAASVAALTFVALHEGEIQDKVLMSDKASDMQMAPALMFNAPPPSDSGSGQIFDSEHFKAKLRSAQDSHAEPPARKASPEPGGKSKAPAMSASGDAAGKFELDESPIETVDELLESVAGVVTNADGEIFIRGGRAGETEYVVDGVPIKNPLEAPTEDTDEIVVDLGTIALERKRTDIGKTITVTAERDIIDKFETSHQATITKEQMAAVDSARPPSFIPPSSEVVKELEGKAAAEEAWQVADAERIPTEKPDQNYQHSVPVTSVDELLKKVAGVVVTKEGDTVIRGGILDVGYIVDGVPIIDPLTGLVRKDHITSGPEVSPDSLASLDDWRTTRDSLQQLIAPPQPTYSFSGIKSKSVEKGQDVVMDSPPPPPPVIDSVDSPTPLERYLKACYKIAELTDRESEYDSALAVIEKHAGDRNSPEQDLARRYLDMIDDLQE